LKTILFPCAIGLVLCTSGCVTQPTQTPSGQQVFATHCAACHGIRGEGDGPVAASLRIPVPNLRTLNERYGGNFPEDQVAGYIDGRNFPDAHGERTMPVWGQVFAFTDQILPEAEDPATRIETLLAYLRTLQNL
jgi:mono/diheme cytochrome c family protein